ncbi:hypothetical protein [Paenirhodobacter populi]|uniref:Uncharacterized protein n=1 Tax=Paenirhodobacter populi TaxID=2306993 RepID=A0A443J7G0_9RHOB|nr:hypothetical protein [Sinirhodobacter populi]RWR16407.1 hypothetical protein D2T30_21690 [Sinirhodobacter populi]
MTLLFLSATQIFAQDIGSNIRPPVVHPQAAEKQSGVSQGQGQNSPQKNAWPPKLVFDQETGVRHHNDYGWHQDRQDENYYPVPNENVLWGKDWAGLALIGTSVGGLASLITVFLVAGTLRVSRNMLREAKAATVAANAAVDVTREIGRDQSRAYLTIHEADIRFHGLSIDAHQNGRKDGYVMSCKVRNTGATPAEWFRFRYEFGMGRRGETPTDEAILASGMTTKWTGPATGRDLDFTVEGMDVSNAIHRVADATEAGIYLFIRGSLEYGTIYNEVREWGVFLHADGDRISSYRDGWTAVFANSEGKAPPVKLQFSSLKE